MYVLFALGIFAWWVFGLLWRFGDSGRAACGELVPADASQYGDDATEYTLKKWEEVVKEKKIIVGDIETELPFQEKSCVFIQYFLDVFGLYVGGFVAWFILSLTGATRTPVWTPKIDKHAA